MGGLLSPLLRPRGGVRCGVNRSEGRGHNDDLDLVAGSLCDMRRQQQRDTMSWGGGGNGGGGDGPTFGVGKVGHRPRHGVVGLTNRVGEIDGVLLVFTRWSRPEGAMLLIDGNLSLIRLQA